MFNLKFSLLFSGKISGDLTDDPEVVTVPSVVLTEEDGSRSGSRFWDVNFSEYFSKNFKKVLVIKPSSGCFSIRYVKAKIWAATGNGVQIFNTKGSNLKSIDIHAPRSVEKAVNGDIFIACLLTLVCM